MKFNVQRVLTPAYLTSVALVVLGVVLALAWHSVAAWLFVLLGLALNAVAVAVTEIHDAPHAPRPAGRRRPSLPVRAPRPSAGAGTRASAGSSAAKPPAGSTGGAAEPEAETAATPIVPSSGSSPLEPRR